MYMYYNYPKLILKTGGTHMQTYLYFPAFVSPKQLTEKLLAMTPRFQAPPKVYGTFHTCSLVIVLIICILMIARHLKASKSPPGKI